MAVAGKPYLATSGAIFGVVALLHFVRAIGQWQVRVGATVFPVWISWVGGVVAAALCLWGLRLASK